MKCGVFVPSRSSTRSTRMPGPRPAASRGHSEHVLRLELLGPRVERLRPDRQILRPRRDKAPSRRLEAPRRGIGLRRVEHDRDAIGRGDVVHWSGRSSATVSTSRTETRSEPRSRPRSVRTCSSLRQAPTPSFRTRLSSLSTGPVRCGDPRHVGLRVVVGDVAATREHSLRGRQPSDRDADHGLGILLGEPRVDLLVLLPVVADEQPPHLGELLASRRRFVSLCSMPLRNQRSCVGPQSVRRIEPGGKRWREQESGERGGDVPGAGGEVDHRRPGVRAHEPLEEHGHPGHRDAVRARRPRKSSRPR